MPPAAKAIATAAIPRVDGQLVLKILKHKGTDRPKASISTRRLKPRDVWLSRDAPHDRLGELLAAFDDITEVDIPDDFKAALLDCGA